MLGCDSYILIISSILCNVRIPVSFLRKVCISRLSTVSMKKLFSLSTITMFLAIVLFFSENNGLILCQNFLLSWSIFRSNYCNISFFLVVLVLRKSFFVCCIAFYWNGWGFGYSRVSGWISS